MMSDGAMTDIHGLTLDEWRTLFAIRDEARHLEIDYLGALIRAKLVIHGEKQYELTDAGTAKLKKYGLYITKLLKEHERER